MKKIFLAAMIASLGSASAFAADLPTRAYTKAPAMVAPVSTWQGLYIGGNVGYGWGNGDTSFSPSDSGVIGFNTTTLDVEPKGVIGGAQFGYNWQVGSFVTGFEVDFQGSDIKGSTKTSIIGLAGVPVGGGAFFSSNAKLSWFGTVRGRLGVAVTPSLLLYTTGGLAYGQVDDSAVAHLPAPVDFPANIGKTKAGWTVGAGGEWMFAGNWSAKLEYLFVDLGKVSAVGLPTDPAFAALAVTNTWKTQENIVRAGLNYKFGGY